MRRRIVLAGLALLALAAPAAAVPVMAEPQSVTYSADANAAPIQTLTLQQFEAQSLARFDAMDLNHDGTVTAAEREQARTQMRAQRDGNAPQ